MSQTDRMPKGRPLLRFVTYATMGAVGTLGHYIILMLAVSKGWLGPVPASVLGAVAGAVINYLLNASITFGTHPSRSSAVKFALTAGAGAALNGALMKLQIELLGIHYLIAQMICTITVLGGSYCVNLLWTFRSNGKETAREGKEVI